MTVPYRTIVYKDVDGYYMAKSNTGTILAENNDTPETVIQAALDRQGVMWWMEGSYNASASFTGLNFKPETAIFSSNDTRFLVPQNYTGGAFIVDPVVAGGTVHNIHMYGGIELDEQGTPTEDWTALQIKCNATTSTGPGICFNEFGPMEINHAKNGIGFDISNTNGWCTSTTFNQISCYYTENGINVIQGVAAPNIGLSSLLIKDFWFQAGGQTLYGMKGLLGSNWTFMNCAIWDMQNSAGGAGTGVVSQFLPTVKGFLILGGIMMYPNPDVQCPPGQIRWIDRHSAGIDFQYIEREYATNGSATGAGGYSWAHGLGFSPTYIEVFPLSDDAMTSPIRWSWDSTNIAVTYKGTPPPPATAGNQNNVKFRWRATIK